MKFFEKFLNHEVGAKVGPINSKTAKADHNNRGRVIAGRRERWLCRYLAAEGYSVKDRAAKGYPAAGLGCGRGPLDFLLAEPSCSLTKNCSTMALPTASASGGGTAFATKRC